MYICSYLKSRVVKLLGVTPAGLGLSPDIASPCHGADRIVVAPRTPAVGPLGASAAEKRLELFFAYFIPPASSLFKYI